MNRRRYLSTMMGTAAAVTLPAIAGCLGNGSEERPQPVDSRFVGEPCPELGSAPRNCFHEATDAVVLLQPWRETVELGSNVTVRLENHGDETIRVDDAAWAIWRADAGTDGEGGTGEGGTGEEGADGEEGETVPRSSNAWTRVDDPAGRESSVDRVVAHTAAAWDLTISAEVEPEAPGVAGEIAFEPGLYCVGAFPNRAPVETSLALLEIVE